MLFPLYLTYNANLSTLSHRKRNAFHITLQLGFLFPRLLAKDFFIGSEYYFLKDISQRVPKFLDELITSMVFDQESVRISGKTDTFNTVDSLRRIRNFNTMNKTRGKNKR